MIKIKICGIKSENDINIINKYMPDYIGFVFAKSLRQVTADMVSNFNIKCTIKKVGVFVNEDINVVCKTARICKLDVIQLHGDEKQQYIDELKAKCDCNIWKAIRVKDENSIIEANKFSVDSFLFDNFSCGEFGGSGTIFDWSLLKKANVKFALAGGLYILNIENAIALSSPQIVDISSGVETNGIKDEEKIKQFIEKVRSYK